MIRVFAMKVTDKDFTGARWDGYLSPARRDSAKRMQSEKNRQLYLGAEALLNLSLEAAGEKLPLPAAYARNAYGKPYLTDAEGLFVNWSHSGEYAVCALADGEVGVDLQFMRAEPKESLVRRVLRPRELARYETAEPEQRTRLFYEYWTVKESFLKALGTGFRTPLKEFYVEMDESGPRIVQRVNQKHYGCRLLELKESGYAAAVCREGGIGEISPVSYLS